MDTLKRVKESRLTVLVYEYCVGYALVRYCGHKGKQLHGDKKFWIHESELCEF